MAILKRRKDVLFTLDHLRFAGVLGLFTAVYKASLCLLRRHRGLEDKWNALISSTLATLVFFIDDEDRRYKLALFFLSRAFEPGLNLADRHPPSQKPWWWSVHAWQVVSIYLLYTGYCEYDIFPPGADRLFRPGA